MKVDAGTMFMGLKSRGQYEFSNFRSKGLYEAGRLVMDRAVQRLCVNYFRTAIRPSLHQMAGMAKSVHMSARDMVRHSFPQASAPELENIESEYDAIQIELESRCATMGDELAYPDWYAIERETSYLLYAVCRLLAPKNMLETGVANGHSTYCLIRAMMKNGHGKLHSVDISDDVGGLLTAEERTHWSLHVLTSPQRSSYSRIVEAVSPIDMFLHDSDHTYGWAAFEYKIAHDQLGPEGVLLSDDVDHSMAYLDYCKARNRKPILLLDTRKVFGLLLPGD